MAFSLTNQENEAFQELKSRIEEEYETKGITDFQFYRFLKARNFVVNQAMDMLVKHLEWREKYHIDTILDDFKMLEVQRKYFQISVIGNDTEGHLIIYLKIGSIDIKGLLKSATASYFMTYLAYFLMVCEKQLCEQSEKLGKPIETWNVIVDMENFPISQAIYKSNIEFLLNGFSMYDSNFPERLKRGFVINASMPFFIAYNIVKRVLSARTIEKARFFGNDGWKEEFVKIFDLDTLPAFLGGKRTDPDGNVMCFETVHHCGIVPERYYSKSQEKRLVGEPGVKTYNLSRNGKVEIVFEVNEVGSTVEWEFETENHDIAFKLSYKGKLESKMKPITIIGTQRVDAHMQLETGTFLCKKVGTYILTLDNSYSWFQRKKIYCRSSVVLPGEQLKNHEN